MKLILGLGNPGTEYATTRHNAGWRVLNHLAIDQKCAPWKKINNGQQTQICVNEQTALLLKPECYMNRSGNALTEILETQNIANHDILVVTDDVALPIGTMRCRESGSCGGHNGLASIETALASNEYPRLRIGVGPKTGKINGEELKAYVLAPFESEEENILVKVIPAATNAILCWLTEGLVTCQNKYNGDDTQAEN